MNRAFAAAAAFLLTAAAGALFADEKTVEMLPGECWWGVATRFGSSMPFTSSSALKIDLRKDGYANQYASFLISDKGRAVWCEEQAEFKFGDGKIRVRSDKGKIEVVEAGKSLKDAFLYSSKR